MKRKLSLIAILVLVISFLVYFYLLPVDINSIKHLMLENDQYASLLFLGAWIFRLLLLIPGTPLIVLGGVSFAIGKALDYFRKVVVKSLDLRNNLPTIQVDPYVFGGKYDAQCPIEFSSEIADLISTSELKIFYQSNHNPFVEEEKAFMDFVKETTKHSSMNNI